jgi:hypothetical protein
VTLMVMCMSGAWIEQMILYVPRLESFLAKWPLVLSDDWKCFGPFWTTTLCASWPLQFQRTVVPLWIVIVFA